MAQRGDQAATGKGGKKKDELSVERSMADFRRAYRWKRRLIEREQEDFRYALGEQWTPEEVETLKRAGFKAFTDNRIQPNLHLLTGLERQNRTDFTAYPIGEEDSIKAEIVTRLFKDAIRKSHFHSKSSDQFKDGITCGESHLELYLDYTESIINGQPRWRKADGNAIFPAPECKEYDFSDAKYIYKVSRGISKGDLINLYPEKKKEIEAVSGSKLSADFLLDPSGTHVQPRDYPKTTGQSPNPSNGSGDRDDDVDTDEFDLVERFYKKFVERVFVGDRKSGQITEMADKQAAEQFIEKYQAGIQRDQKAYEDAVAMAVLQHREEVAQEATQAAQAQGLGALPAPAAYPGQGGAPPAPGAAPGGFGDEAAADAEGAGDEAAQEGAEPPAEEAQEAPAQEQAEEGQAGAGPAAGDQSDVALHVQALHAQGRLPPPPPKQDPQRFFLISRQVPEIWCFAHTPGVEDPLCDERAWFYPKWKTYPFVPYFARFSTAPLSGENERHLLVQGLVHGVKGAQEKHNKAEMLMLRHLNSSANSGWLSEEDVWVDQEKVRLFGTTPGVNLEYKKGRQAPQRIEPTVLSNAHAQVSLDSAEAIKAQLGINSDLIAASQSGTDSGRAIALRQRQGLLMVQELFDNLTRTRELAGRLMLSQLGEMYDTDSAMQVLGQDYLKENFPPPMMGQPDNPQGQPQPMRDPETGQPMQFDKQMAEVAIAEVLQGSLGDYHVIVGEVVASDTQRMANASALQDLAKTYGPSIVPPQVIVESSDLPEATKKQILAAIGQAQQAAQIQKTADMAAKVLEKGVAKQAATQAEAGAGGPPRPAVGAGQPAKGGQ